MCNVQTLRRKLDRNGYSLIKLGRGDSSGYVIVDQQPKESPHNTQVKGTRFNLL